MESAKCAIEVTAGLIPMQPLPELTRRWWITSVDYDAAAEKNRLQTVGPDQVMAVDHLSNLFSDTLGPALAYANLLMLQPDRYNFVRVDWIWF